VLLRAFVGLTLLAVAELLVVPGRAAESFAWSIKVPANAAWIGAAFAAGCVLSVVSLRQRRWSEIRIPIATVAVFTALTEVATLVHAHRLHLADGSTAARVAAWVWLLVYLVVPVACLAVLGRQERGASRPPVARPLPRWLAAALAVQGTVFGAAGVVLFVGNLMVHQHSPASSSFWPWQLMPISGQVVGAWLIAFAVAAALSILVADLRRLLAATVAYTVFGVLQLLVLVRYTPQAVAGDPRLWGYAAFLVSVVVTGACGWWLARAQGAARASREGSQIRRPTSVHSAGTSTERTRKVSSSTPNATVNPIWAANTSGSTVRTAKVAASTMPAEVMTPPVTASPRRIPSRVP